MFRDLRISTFNLLNLLMVSALILLLWAGILLQQRYTFRKLTGEVGREYMAFCKQLVSGMVTNCVGLIKSKKSCLEQRLLADLRKRTEEGHRLAEHLYNINRSRLPDPAIQREILWALESHYASFGGGYYFICSSDGSEMLSQAGPGSDSDPNLAAEKSTILADIRRLVENRSHGDTAYIETQPEDLPAGGPDRLFSARIFEPYGWVIGTGEDTKKIKAEIQEELIQWIDQLRFSSGGYMWIAGQDLAMLVHPLCKQDEYPEWYQSGGLWNCTDLEGKSIFTELRDSCLARGSGFIEYRWEKPGQTGSFQKIAYAELIEDWGWILCAGLYLDNMEQAIIRNGQSLEKTFASEILRLSITASLLVIILLGLTHFFATQLNRAFTVFRDHCMEAAHSLGEIDPHSLYFDDFKCLAVNFNKMVSDRRDIVSRLERSEKRLAQAQKLEAIGRFASGIAHDFGNLMMVVQGNIEMLLWNSINQEQARDVLKEILQASKKASDLTHRLLVFSKREALHAVYIDLNRLVSNLGDILRRIIGEDIKLVTDLAEDLGPIKADPVHIEQIVINLALNARDAMPAGGLLRIVTANVTREARFVVPDTLFKAAPAVLLEISDTGKGMGSYTRQHLFEPFFTTKDQNGGSGLGLATVYGIVKQSGGEIEVFSEPGYGTTFSISFPRAPGETREDASPPEPLLDKGNGETILLVEDEPHVREVIASSLRLFGFQVIEATGGTEALNILQHDRCSHIDLILTDVVMPGMNGEELLARLPVRYKDTAVLLMTGYPGTNTLGSKPFVQKPFSSQALVAKIQKLLKTGNDPPAG
jgi:signal transduction histidine kinase